MATLKRTLREMVAYPEHGPRAEDPHYGVFNAARHHLIDVLGVGCWIGGATKAQIEAGLPPGHRCAGAVQLEAHHHIAEQSGLNEEDWQLVAADFPQLGIHSDEDFRNIAEGEGGLLILCDKHHRGPNHGIHAITEPAWKLDKYAMAGYEFLPDLATAKTVTVETTKTTVTVESAPAADTSASVSRETTGT